MLSRVGAVILAAGQSSRMGRTKQLLPLGESTVLEQTIAMVRRSAVEEIVLVLGAGAVEIGLRLAGVEHLTVVVNHAYAEGMASSLQAGLAALQPQTTAALIVLGDQPLIRSQTLDRLAQAHRNTNAQMLIPTYQGSRGNPVLLDRSVFSEAMALEGDVGCRALFQLHPEAVLKVEVGDAGILLDIDSQEDYERVLASLEPPPRIDG